MDKEDETDLRFSTRLEDFPVPDLGDETRESLRLARIPSDPAEGDDEVKEHVEEENPNDPRGAATVQVRQSVPVIPLIWHVPSHPNIFPFRFN
jgi:hypothetical protein